VLSEVLLRVILESTGQKAKAQKHSKASRSSEKHPKSFCGIADVSYLSTAVLTCIIEHLVFPFLNQKLDFSHEKAQHAVIHAGLDSLAADLRAAKEDTSKFDPDALKASMIALREPLVSLSRSPPR
jgi:hypothetical protein